MIDTNRIYVYTVTESENIHKRAITWLFKYNPETQRQSMQWVGEGEAGLKKARMSKSQVNTMLVEFFDKKGLIYKEFLPQKTTMNAELYLNIFRCHHEQIYCVRPELWANNSRLFQQDNTPMHSAFKIRDFFAKNQVNVLNHPPYSPDLAPSNFFLFRKFKNTLKGHHFQNVEDIQKNLTAALQGIKEEEFSACFKQQKHRTEKCIQSRGNYFDGENLSDTAA